MENHKIVSREEWINARREHLKKEKEFTRLRDQLSRERRELPWVKVEKQYAFQGPSGKESLSDLFSGRSQLLTYHFMFAPEWEEGCKSCSLLADSFNPSVVHLAQRDVTFVAVSRAPIDKIEAFKKRMGWSFKWVSSHGGDFNYDFQVSFKQDEFESGNFSYNYQKGKFPASEAPGVSAFRKQGSDIFHTYSSFARGLDMFMANYHYMDITSKGRDEDKLGYPMEWVRHHDKYVSE